MGGPQRLIVAVGIAGIGELGGQSGIAQGGFDGRAGLRLPLRVVAVAEERCKGAPARPGRELGRLLSGS